MWNMGAGPNALIVYRIEPSGRLAEAQVIRVPGLIMNHDFAVSERHLVCVLPDMRFDPARLRAGHAFIDAIDLPRGQPMRVLVIDKADLSRRRWYELPPGFIFHFGNAWDDGGTLRFDYVHHEDPSVLTEALGGMMRGDPGAVRDRSAVSTDVSIDLATGIVRTQPRGDTVEFPRVDPRRVGRRYRHLWHVASVATGAGTLHPNAVVRYDLETGGRDLYRYAPGTVVEEHVAIPDPAASREGAGWLVGCTYDVASARTCVNVFEATRLSAGPVARAMLPYGLPLGFHGDFVAA
jgi:carotenoid cleavage dioxygenase